MTIPLHPTPREAALSGFPPEHCRVAAAAEQGDDAYVLLDTGPAGHPYLYGVSVTRVEGGWRDGTSGNGPGWTLAESEGELGTATAWGEAPYGADRVRVAFRGDAREVPVENGVYLAAWWRVPGTGDLPSVLAFRVRGTWVPEPSGA